MQLYVSNKNKSPRLFKNPFLEYVSHIHPATPLIYLPVVAYFLVRAFGKLPIATVLGLFVVGVLFWALTEYVLHRFVFHFKPTTAKGKRLQFLFHGFHHDYPRDSSRLVLPLTASCPLALFFYYLFHAVFGDYHTPLFAGLLMGYLSYDSIHYAVHHMQWSNRFFLRLRAHHYRHHYQDPNSGFGVSSPLFDVLIGSLPEQKKITEEILI